MAKKASQRPGVVMYFEDHRITSELSRESKADLWDAIMEYGQYGTLPDFPDITDEAERRVLLTAWRFFKQKVDLDNVRYNKKKKSNERANKIKFILNHPELGLNRKNEDDIARIVKDKHGHYIVAEYPVYEDDEPELLPHQLEAIECQQAERQLMIGGQVLMTEEEINKRIREEVLRLAMNLR